MKNLFSSLHKPAVRNAIFIGTLCSASYLAVYFARNILGAITPQMLAEGYTEDYIGKVSSLYFICYAFGQLINGSIGDKVKARYMICIGLFFAGITNYLFSAFVGTAPTFAQFSYGFTGFFLSMIYGPITKVVSENTDPLYTPRCTLGYVFASLIGTPLAGIAAIFLAWRPVFWLSSLILFVMALCSFTVFRVLEKKEIIKYNQYQRKKEEGGSIKVLIKHRIIKFTFVSILTGVVRTTVVFWMPTYISQYLGFSPEAASFAFTGSTFLISLTAVFAIPICETVLKHDMDLTIFYMFLTATICFLLLYFVKQPIINIIFLTLAIMAATGASCMMFSKYCPSLRDTGMVSSATGYLDFVSYIAASVSSTLFANATTQIGWKNLILIWAGLMAVGILISLPLWRRKAK